MEWIQSTVMYSTLLLVVGILFVYGPTMLVLCAIIIGLILIT